jgi:hypothetical protein
MGPTDSPFITAEAAWSAWTSCASPGEEIDIAPASAFAAGPAAPSRA